MKARILNLTAVAFVLLLGVATSQAQHLVASIPFDFQVGARHMAAGRYAVWISTDGSLTIRGLNTTDGAFVLTNSIGSAHPEQEAPRLVFLRLGSAYHLSQVWNPSLQDGREIPSRENRQIEASNGGNQETAVALVHH